MGKLYFHGEREIYFRRLPTLKKGLGVKRTP